MKRVKYVMLMIVLILTATVSRTQTIKQAQEFYENGLIASESNRFDDAVKYFLKAIESAPESPVLWNHLGAAYSRLGEKEGALKAYRQAVVIAPYNAVARYNFGNAFYQSGYLKEAAVELNLATNLRPEFKEALLDLGAVQIELSEFNLAEQSF